MTAPIAKRADQLVVGDRIPSKYLPGAFASEPGEVIYVRVDTDHQAVFVGVSWNNGCYDGQTFMPSGLIEVHPADPTGLGYSRADDGETTQPIAGRMPAQYGAVEVAGGLVEIDPPEDFVPASAPAYLFGLDAGPMGEHSGGCAWPDVQCIGHPSAD